MPRSWQCTSLPLARGGARPWPLAGCLWARNSRLVPQRGSLVLGQGRVALPPDSSRKRTPSTPRPGAVPKRPHWPSRLGGPRWTSPSPPNTPLCSSFLCLPLHLPWPVSPQVPWILPPKSVSSVHTASSCPYGSLPPGLGDSGTPSQTPGFLPRPGSSPFSSSNHSHCPQMSTPARVHRTGNPQSTHCAPTRSTLRPGFPRPQPQRLPCGSQRARPLP